MEISKEQLIAAAQKLGLSKSQIESLWESLGDDGNSPKSMAFSKVIYYFGALIIISAMTWLMGLGWEWFGGGGMLLISLAYALFFLGTGAWLWNKRDLKIPGGLLVTLAVCMTPLAIYGFETYFGIWPKGETAHYQDFYSTIRNSWLFMDIGTICAGLLALRYFPFPFLTAPVFIAVWFLVLDIIQLFLGQESTWEQKSWVSLFMGLAIVWIAFVIDRKTTKDFAFWAYFVGTCIFWGSLTSLCIDKGELVLFIYLLVNILMMGLSVLLQRNIFIILGAFGAFVYFSHLAYEVFQDSMIFPFVLSLIGLLIIYLGILYQKHHAWLESTLFNALPAWMQKVLPK